MFTPSHLSASIAAQLGYDFYNVNNATSGAPRYVIHFMAFINRDKDTETDTLRLYDIALQRAKKIGFKVYRAKSFGGGFVIESWNLDNTADQVIDIRDGTNLYNHAA